MIRVRINWTGPAAGFSVLHFGDDLSTSGAAQAAADAVTSFILEFDQTLSTQMTAQVDPEVLQVNIATGQTEGVETVTSSPITGGTADAMLPQATQALLRWRSGQFVAGREIRGRTFVPGFTEASGTTNGEVDTTVIALLNTAAGNLISNTNIGIWSPTRGVFASAQSASTWGEWAVLRGRRQ